MTPVREKVDALVARALNAGSSTEEARTSAMIAVKLIAGHGLLEQNAQPPRVIYVEVNRPAPPPSRRVIRSKFAGQCRACGAHHIIGASIAWSKTEGVVCVPCHSKGRAA
jgi:hypothetical protein